MLLAAEGRHPGVQVGSVAPQESVEVPQESGGVPPVQAGLPGEFGDSRFWWIRDWCRLVPEGDAGGEDEPGPEQDRQPGGGSRRSPRNSHDLLPAVRRWAACSEARPTSDTVGPGRPSSPRLVAV